MYSKPKDTTLVCKETDRHGTYVRIDTYSPGDMLEIFNPHQIQALEAGRTVKKGRVVWVSAIALAAPVLELDDKVTSVVEKIARESLGLESLEPQNRDCLDFKEFHVSRIKDALTAAVQAGREC